VPQAFSKIERRWLHKPASCSTGLNGIRKMDDE
jgi:hypothetical protein